MKEFAIHIEGLRINTEGSRVNTEDLQFNTEGFRFNPEDSQINAEASKINTEAPQFNTEALRINVEKDPNTQKTLINECSHSPIKVSISLLFKRVFCLANKVCKPLFVTYS